jgi:nucleotide-binding universal stress UspA family protein
MSESRIIVGVDDSDGSHRALWWATDEAARTGRDLVVTTVFSSSAIGAGLNPSGEPAAELRQMADEIVSRAVSDVAIQEPGVHSLGRTVIGAAGPVLAACGPQDVLVVGNRGRGGFASLMLGSVGHYLVAHARTTVVVVRGRPDLATGPVVAGVHTATADTVLRHAFEEADSRGVRLRAIHPYPPIEGMVAYGYTPAVGGAKERQAGNQDALTELVRTWAAKFPQVSVDIVAVEGHPSAVLVAESATAQLMVVGHQRSLLGHVGVGAVAAQLLHHANCPVMIVRASES